MELFGWLFGTREVPGRAQAEFNHPKIYGEVETGPGVSAASLTAASWRDRVSAAFGDADADLDRVLKKFDVVMQGAAGEQAKDAVTPLSQATRQSIEVAAQVGAAVEQQAQGSADFKNAFPPPYQVPRIDIGWTDYVNPVAYAAKSGVRAAHEEQHDRVEAQAREQYESYTQASNNRVSTVQRFDPPPKFVADVAPAPTAPVPKIDPGYISPVAVGSTEAVSGQSSTNRGSSPADISSTTPGQESPGGTLPAEPGSSWAQPAESGSAWATPPAAGVSPTLGTPGPGVGGGFVGGVVMPPGSTSGPGTPGTGGRVGGGTGGLGTGRGPGVGGGGNRVLGPGGSSGVGGATPGSVGGSGGAGARGATSGVAAGAGAPARGKREDDDKEHTNKYLEPTAEAWQELGLPKVAPPVFGDWAAQDDKPPRPPEEAQ